MPGKVLDGTDPNGSSHSQSPSSLAKDNTSSVKPTVDLTSKSQLSEALEVPCANTSIDQLYDNVYEMQSSGDEFPSRNSFGSDGDESRVDSELRHLVGGEIRTEEMVEEEEIVSVKSAGMERENGSSDKKHERNGKNQFNSKASGSSKQTRRTSRAPSESDETRLLNKNSPESADKSAGKTKKPKNFGVGEAKLQNGSEDPSQEGLDNPNLGPYLLKHAKDLIAGDNHRRALKYAVRAAKSFEVCSNGKPSLDLVMSLHVLGAIHCSLGQHAEAVPVLEHALKIPVLEEGQEHALAKFAGHMQLGDTFAMLGRLENAIASYSMGLEIQKQTLGEKDPRVGETCRYLAEVYVQALQFDEAERLCKVALDIHRENGEPASLEETADRRLMGLICETKGDPEGALEHLVLASMAMVSHGQESEVASVDCSIGDAYLSLSRYDEAIFAYQKALTKYKSSKGENHPAVASVFVRLADLSNKTGKIRESKSYCENALRIYGKPPPGTPSEDVASGYTDVSSVFESMGEYEQSLKLLQKALKIYDGAPGQQSTIAGIEAQMGVLHYIIGNFSESYLCLRNAITKLRANGEKKSAFFGIALNQLGLTCVQRYAINEAADFFEEARVVLEQEYGPYHPETLGVYSNLAGTYDAMGRLGEAIQILENVVAIREEKLGTANPDVDDEKRRLAELLKEAGRVRSRKVRSLETLLDTNTHTVK